MMNDAQFSPQEQVLIERLRNAPRTKLSPEKAVAIRGQMLAAVNARPSPPRIHANGRYLLMTTVAVVVVIIVFVTLGLPSQNGTTETTSTATVAPTSTLNSETPTAEMTPTLTIETLVPQPTETTYPVVVIEGPVTEITATTITVFDNIIQVDSSNSIFSDLQIGDIVRVDGQTVITDGTVTITAITIVIVNIEDYTGGTNTGEGLPSSCKRTKNGKITCK